MKIKQKILCFTMIGILIFSMNVSGTKISKNLTQYEIDESIDHIQDCLIIPSNEDEGDLDPLVDLQVTVTIKEIRALDKIDFIGKPDFYVKVFINDEMSKSKIWRNQKYVNETWSTTVDVPDDEQNVTIKIQLWDAFPLIDRICDLSENYNREQLFGHKYDIDLLYNLKIGHWTGEDYIDPSFNWPDLSGYGRLNGCDDNSIYQRDRDCLILFDITQNDYDGDGIPYWTEVNVYGTDPEIDDTGRDDDDDGVPIEWEHKWGNYIGYDWHNHTLRFIWAYHPFKAEDHAHLDPDDDGLDNIEEYLVSKWDSDPFRKDIFVELDQMEAGPNGEPVSMLTEWAKDLLRDAFDRQNIVLHIDDGNMGGGEILPFDNETNDSELVQLYEDYFLHGDENIWRRSVFHYGLVVYEASYGGFVFGTDDSYWGAYQIASKRIDKKMGIPTAKRRAVTYASVYMHELGHTLQINMPGGHDQKSKGPWQIRWWKWHAYKSTMNYRYTYLLVDYSDGSRGKNDHDDWSTLNLKAFQGIYVD
jgi:hypothetical protein